MNKSTTQIVNNVKRTAGLQNIMFTQYLLHLYLIGRYTPTPARSTGEQTVIRILNLSNPRLSPISPREQNVIRILSPSNPRLSSNASREQHVIKILSPSNPRLSSNTPREQTVIRILNPSYTRLSLHLIHLENREKLK